MATTFVGLVGFGLRRGVDPSSTRCEGAEKSAEYRVLVVGAGLTGSAAAALIRREWPTTSPRLHLTVWERASYPAGRFGAAAFHGADVADMGAQVLSIIDTDEEHAHAGEGGHGITLDAIELAKAETQRFQASGLLRPAEDDHLAPTEERMLWEGIWKHFHAPSGLVSILYDYLREARPDELHFGHRVHSVSRVGNLVNVSARAIAPDEHEEEHFCVSESFDTVVVCVPAPAALCIDGLTGFITTEQSGILRSVAYDARSSVAVFYRSELSPKLNELFDNVCEIDLDRTMEGKVPLALLAWQDAKKTPGSSRVSCTVVAHTPPSLCGEMKLDTDLVESVHDTLSRKVGISVEQLRAWTVDSKRIDWTVSQVVRPMEAVVEPVPKVSCFVSKQQTGGNLVVAGDFLTQSSYLGSMTSALEASKATIEAAHAAHKEK